METGHELFVHGLKDMMDAEHQLVEALQGNAGDSSRPDLRKAFEQHRKETEGKLKGSNSVSKYWERNPKRPSVMGSGV